MGREPLGKIRALAHRAPCTWVRCWRQSAATSTRAAYGARWLVRIEDLDTPRVVPGCADEMLRTLEAFGFEWDGEVLFQSTRRAAYREALDALTAAGRTYPCSCSRKDLAGLDEESRAIRAPAGPDRRAADPTALRFRVSDAPIHFDDLFLGPQNFDLASLRRRGGRAPRRPG